MKAKVVGALAAAALFSGCGGPAPLCVSASGIAFEGWTDGREGSWSCAEIDRAVDMAAEEFQKSVVGDSRLSDPRKFKRALAGYSVSVAATKVFLSPEGDEVAGRCDCTLGLIIVGDTPWTNATLAHEMAHAAQSCILGHVGWKEGGVTAATYSYQRRAESEAALRGECQWAPAYSAKDCELAAAVGRGER